MMVGLSGRLVTEEHMEQGSVATDTYLTYCRAAGGFLLCLLVLISFAVPVVCSAFTDWWLSRWILFVRTVHRPLALTDTPFRTDFPWHLPVRCLWCDSVTCQLYEPNECLGTCYSAVQSQKLLNQVVNPGMASHVVV